MTDVNIAMSRQLLSCVRLEAEAVGYKVNKDAWVIQTWHQPVWEFHGPGGYYETVRADNAYEARWKGWRLFLRDRLDLQRRRMTDESMACPDCEEGRLQYQPEEWEGGERPALQYPELYFCNECGVTHTPKEIRERFL